MTAIRAFRPEDADALRALHRAAILATGAWYTEAERRSWAAGLQAGNYVTAYAGAETCLVACDGERIAGFTSFAGDTVKGLYVHPERQGEGIGALLLQRAEAALLAAGGPRTLHIDSSLAAIGFYERHGYRLVGRNRRATRGGLEIACADLEKPSASTPPHP